MTVTVDASAVLGKLYGALAPAATLPERQGKLYAEAVGKLGD